MTVSEWDGDIVKYPPPIAETQHFAAVFLSGMNILYREKTKIRVTLSSGRPESTGSSYRFR